MNRTQLYALGVTVVATIGAIPEDMPFVSAFITWSFGLPLRILSAFLTFGDAFFRVAQATALARRFGEWKRGAIDLAEVLGNWLVPIEESINEPINEFMTIGNGAFGGIFDAMAGVAGLIGGIFRAAYGATEWLREIEKTAGAFVPGVNKIKELQPIGDVFGILLSPLDIIAGFFEFVAEFFSIFADLTAIESLVFIIGTVMVTGATLIIVRRLAAMIASAGITFGLTLIFDLLFGIPKLIQRTIDMLVVASVGVTLMIWAFSPLFGSLLIAGIGILLTTAGLLEDNGRYGSYGIPTMALGLAASFAGFNVGFLGYVFVTVLVVTVYVEVLGFVDDDLQRLIRVGAI